MFRPSAKALSPTRLVTHSPANYDDIQVRTVEVTSKDGTRVPLTLLIPRRAMSRQEPTPNYPPIPPRYESLDAWRGAAILAIVLVHSAYLANHHPDPPSRASDPVGSGVRRSGSSGGAGWRSSRRFGRCSASRKSRMIHQLSRPKTAAAKPRAKSYGKAAAPAAH